MRILGIIAEYDPFHRGHERHLTLARQAVKPDFTYVVISGCWKQRGEPALLSPYDRAACALAAGADAVFALPTAWTVRDAEHYALGAVALLHRLGATHLAFGAEEGSLDRLRACADLLEAPLAGWSDLLKRKMKTGMGYPRALGETLAETDPALGGVMQKPNNILGVCYLRAIRNLGADMTPTVIPRRGSYRAERVDPEEPSAARLRADLTRGAWGPALAALPSASEAAVRRAFLSVRVCREESLDTLLIHRLRSMSREELAELPDVGEGLEDRIRRAAAEAGTRQEMLDRVSGRRYPRARVSRILTWALLGGKGETLARTPLPREAVLLGLRENPAMTAAWHENPGLIVSRFQDDTDLTGWKIWAQGARLPDSLPWTEKMRKYPADSL